MLFLHLHILNKLRLNLLPKVIRASFGVPADESICGNNEVFVTFNLLYSLVKHQRQFSRAFVKWNI